MFIGMGKGTLAMYLLLFRDTVLLIPLLIGLTHCFGLNGAWMAVPVSTILAFFIIRFWAKKELHQLEIKSRV
jgi:Na+-driven multidrug efflux pump